MRKISESEKEISNFLDTRDSEISNYSLSIKEIFRYPDDPNYTFLHTY